MHHLIEVCVDRIDSVQACADAGVDRIELCAALSEGGLTPSLGFLIAARQKFSGTIMMMIRPRCGDFLYSNEEIELMLHDIACGKNHGADGFVFGCLQADGEIDAELTARLCAAAAPRPVTFHRAFDVTPDLSRSLETLITLGIPRVLTSGGECDVWQGFNNLRSLAELAAGRIIILPGGGVTADRAMELLSAIPTYEIHLSARITIPSAMRFRRDDIRMGATQITAESLHKIADTDTLRTLLRHLTHHP